MSRDDRNPKLGSTAFICPHCKAFAQQRWFNLYAETTKEPPEEASIPQIAEFLKEAQDTEARGEEPKFPSHRLEGYLRALSAGLPQLDHAGSGLYVYWHLNNAYASDCFACEKPSIWLAGKVIFPKAQAEVPEPNSDLPPDIRRDYREAAEIVLASPRAAAALLRLALQKLCSHLLEREGAINEMIAELVARGLNPIVQRALDVVRVIGNEAVHPGSLDLRDDQATAMQLFGLVNLVTEAMITQPKHVMELYGSLPPDKVSAIEQRDARAKKDAGK